MSDTTYAISSVGPGDRYIQAEVDALLEREGIHRDQHLDYTAAAAPPPNLLSIYEPGILLGDFFIYYLI